MEYLTLDKVAKRRKHLIRHGLWDFPKTEDIDAWTKQFSSAEDQQIAMIALDALIVRSIKSAASSIFYMFCSVLPSIIQCDLDYSDNFGAIPYSLLRNRKFVKDFKIQRLEPPTDNPGAGQSSDDIIRDLRYKFSVNTKYFDMPDDSTPHVLLVDEFSGSGTQAIEAIVSWKDNLSASTKISVFFMAIHENGLLELRKQLPAVQIYAAEILGQESCLLHHINEILKLNSMEFAKLKLKTFIKRNFSQERGVNSLGYKGMSLCFKPPYTACNNMAGVYLLKTKKTKVRLFERGL